MDQQGGNKSDAERDWSFIGRNVRALRRRAGMSQIELAGRCGINQGGLSRIETGINLPTSPVIFALSRALGVPTDALFAATDADRLEAITAAGRAPIRVALDDSSPAPASLAAASRVMDAILALEDMAGAQKTSRIPLNMLSGHNEARIAQTVDALRAYMGIQSGVLFDHFELFEAFGLRVVVMPLDEETDGMAFYDPPHRNAFLFIHADRNPERQLFRLCYEFGHIQWFASDGTPDRPEDLDPRHGARKFAALFLLPVAAVRATVLQLGIRDRQWTYELLLRIKHRFGVSAEMFLYRLHELDLIDAALVEPLKARIHAFYAETGNQEPDASRRILTPNGRTWDLALTAKTAPEHAEELAEIERTLVSHGVVRK
jgi:transcriptional regulator with XRE-family HTH domain/Zn-dependent peptidase ImmA (M78 family)